MLNRRPSFSSGLKSVAREIFLSLSIKQALLCRSLVILGFTMLQQASTLRPQISSGSQHPRLARLLLAFGGVSSTGQFRKAPINITPKSNITVGITSDEVDYNGMDTDRLAFCHFVLWVVSRDTRHARGVHDGYHVYIDRFARRDTPPTPPWFQQGASDSLIPAHTNGPSAQD